MNNKQIIIEAPLSYTGSQKRIVRLWDASDTPWIKWALLLPSIVLLLLSAWSFITAWYLCWGIWLVPYRMVRRSSRKQKVEANRHAEMMAAMKGTQR